MNAKRSASSSSLKVGRTRRNSFIFSSMTNEWFHMAAESSKKEPFTAVRPRSGPMRPPAPRTAWHWTHPLVTKRDWPLIGSPNSAFAIGAVTSETVSANRAAIARRRPERSLMAWLRDSRQVALDPRDDLVDRLLPSLADLPDGDDGEELREDSVEEDEHGQETREERPLHPGGGVGRGGEGKPGVRKAGHDDQEPFQPHPDLDRHRRDDAAPDRSPRAAIAEERERDDEARDDHRPEVWRKRALRLRPENHHVSRLGAVVGGQEFREGEVEPEEREDQQEKAEVVEVDRLEVGLQVIRLPDDGHRDEDPRDAGEDRPDHEVGPEDGGVPHRLDRHGEDPGHDRVHADGDRDHDDGHHRDRLVQKPVLLWRARPAEGQRLVEPPPARHAVSENRDVGDQRKVQVDGCLLYTSDAADDLLCVDLGGRRII